MTLIAIPLTPAERKKRTTLTPEEFVQTWQAADSLEEVIDATGLTREGSLARAAYYRKNGVPLQKFRKVRVYKKLDFNKLATLAAEINGSRKRKL